MCGFFAVLQPSPVIESDAARDALDALSHRGPDASGEWCADGVFLGHRRLSIIDLATGGQPMHSADRRLVVIFNGEIYNFLELRERLIRDGATFTTHSDTEVILEGYRRWGRDVVHHLHGMFAFLIWDRARKCAFGARDRLGIKPLCWSMRRGALIVSSTLEPFRVLGDDDAIDPIAVRDLMSFDYIPAPRTIFKHVYKLEPGSRFEWNWGDQEPSIDRYWTPPLTDPASTPPDEEELEELLDRAVIRQMISDVPIGAFLSGGIDSSLLVAFMARHSSRPVRTFSVAFAEGGVDESPIAALVAQRFGTEHMVLRAEDVGSDALLELLGNLDEPFCDPTLVPTYLLARWTKRHVKVALSGDGGDEVFGGYPKYLCRPRPRRLPLSSSIYRLLKAVPWRPRGMGRVLPRLVSDEDQIRYAWTSYGDFPVFRKDLRQLIAVAHHDELEIERYFHPWEQRAKRYGTEFETDVLMRADLETYLSENCLVKTDRASMLASLEVRVPYLDETILDRILPLAAHEKIIDGQLKALLTPIARRLLPKEVWDRPKHGFTVPLGYRLANAWRPAVEAVLDWGESHVDMFDYSYLRRLHRINLVEGEITRELWNPFVLIAWTMARSSRQMARCLAAQA
jgi:asparagine synthase (glutamine-hydrolysing)